MNSSVIVIIDNLCSSFLASLKAELIYSSVLFIFLVGSTFLLRKRSPNWQIGLWSLLLIRLLLPPDISFCYSCRTLIERLGFSDWAHSRTAIKVSSNEPGSPFLFPEEHSNEQEAEPVQVLSITGVEVNRQYLLSVHMFLAGCWFAGIFFFCVLYIRKFLFFHSLVRNGNLIESGLVVDLANKWRQLLKIDRKVEVYSSGTFLSPFSMGTIRPKILIPGLLLDRSNKSTLESVIAHEIAHIKRYDDIFIKIQNLVQIIYFFNPIVWYVNGRINDAREMVCDSMVLAERQVSPIMYCRGIISVLKLNVCGRDILEPVSCFIENKKKLEKRLLTLIEGGSTMTSPKAFTIFSIIALLSIFVLPMAISQTTSDEIQAKNTDQEQIILSDNHEVTVEDDGTVIVKKKDGKKLTVSALEEDGKIIIKINRDGEEKRIEMIEKDGNIIIMGLDDTIIDIKKVLEGIHITGDAFPDNVFEHIMIDEKGGKIVIPNQTDLNILAKGYSPLLKSSLTGDEEQVKTLLDEGGDVNETDAHKSTPLTLAAEFGHLDVVKTLLDNGADINVTDDDGDTALILALMKKHDEMVELLLDKGAEVKVINKKGWTPLMWAAMNGNVDAVEKLVKMGADVNAHDSHNSTALTLAAQFGYKEIAKLLVNKGALINTQDDDGDSPLLLAMLKGHDDIADMLIRKGADITVRNRHGSTLLTLAAERGMPDVARMLIKQGLDVNTADKDGDSPLLLALLKNHEEIADMLLDNDADIMAVNDNGMTTLMFAAKKGNLKFVKYFVKKGVRIDQKNDMGSTALMIAAFHGQRKTVNYLLKAGAKFDVTQDSGRTALILAAWNGHNDILNDLIEFGAHVNHKDHHKSTALTIAAEMGHTEVIQSLIKHDADLNAKDDDGDSALKLAKMKKHSKIIQLLEEAGAQE